MADQGVHVPEFTRWLTNWQVTHERELRAGGVTATVHGGAGAAAAGLTLEAGPRTGTVSVDLSGGASLFFLDTGSECCWQDAGPLRGEADVAPLLAPLLELVAAEDARVR
jgi:hypothetical protein